MKKKAIITGLLATMLIAGTIAMTGCSCTVSTDSNQNSTGNTGQNVTNNATNNTTANAAQGTLANNEIVGNYKLIEKTDDGVTLNEAQLTAQNKGRTLEVKADGTAVKKEADGDVKTYTYDSTKFIEPDGDAKAYTYSNNTIKITDGDDIYTYQKV